MRGEIVRAVWWWFIFHDINTRLELIVFHGPQAVNIEQFRFTKRVKVTEDGDVSYGVRFSRQSSKLMEFRDPSRDLRYSGFLVRNKAEQKAQSTL